MDMHASENLDATLGSLSQLGASLENLLPLNEKLVGIVRDGVEKMLLNGESIDGTAAPPLKASDKQRGSGPPGLPHGTSSRLITQMHFDVSASGVKLTWPGFPAAIYPLSRDNQLGINQVTLDQLGKEALKYLKEKN